MKQRNINSPGLLAFSICCLWCAAFYSCKKNDNRAPEKDEFSFVYEGVTYKKTVTNNVASAGVSNYNGIATISIDMPSVFGGLIYFARPGCAYLARGFKAINIIEPNCQLSITSDYGSHKPIDSTLVFLYQSGSINITFSNYVLHTYRDIYSGQTTQYYVCHASGTFDLTLANKNNEEIKITNGIVSMLIRRYPGNLSQQKS